MDYRDTVLLPKTDFPMRANLAKREPKRIAQWGDAKAYHALQDIGKQQDRPVFILHDGPPYANGHIHIGTAANKIWKDMVVRSRSMDGYRVPYIPGWDTHGLPIEAQVVKERGQDVRRLGPLALRQLCRDYALRYVDVQRDEFRRLGVWGDWDNPYLTLDPEYEAHQVALFGRMAERGTIYKGKKPVYWCAACETALAEAEIEYDDHVSPSIYVAFSVQDDRGIVGPDSAVIIWTTTPWTIPANLAIAVHPDFEYVEVTGSAGSYIVARDLLKTVQEQMGWDDINVVRQLRGTELEGIATRHPLYDRSSPIVLAEHVTLETGTGCVHIAPGHGLEDYEVGQKYGLETYAPIDSRGRFTDESGPYAGLSLDEGNRAVIDDLRRRDALLSETEVEHSYPHCWRCKNPVAFRATEQWFASVDAFREEAIRAIEDVEWIPAWGIDRIRNMVADRSDWCISRQRTWGVPLPIFYCVDCDETLMTPASIAAVAQHFREHGSDGWYTHDADAILPDDTACSDCGGNTFRKEQDTMDVWFDSGSSHRGVLAVRDELSFPADMYLEGSDQHRGWFQSSLLTSVAIGSGAPYRSVLTHGFIVDGEGRKMSKSLGNTIAPEEVIDKYGADILRLWAASADYRGDVRVSPEILAQMADVYRRIRNTSRFLLGNLHDFDAGKDSVALDDMEPIDRWAVLRTRRLLQKGIDAYRSYAFHGVHQLVHNFCSVDMGGFYLDVIKDRLYCDEKDSPSRRSAQTAMTHILQGLVKLIAPVLVFTADEIWEQMPASLKDADSVHFSRWPSVEDLTEDLAFEEQWEDLLDLRRVVARVLEKARDAKLIRSPQSAEVEITAPDRVRDALHAFAPDMATYFMVAEAGFGPDAATHEITETDGDVIVGVSVTEAAKCDRCWRHTEDVGHDGDHPSLCSRCTDVVVGQSV